MTAPRKVALGDEAVVESAAEHCRTVQCDDDTFPTEDFIAGARFARDFYEQREAKWREYVELLTKENGALAGIAIAHGWAGSAENYEDGKRLRAALGLEG